MQDSRQYSRREFLRLSTLGVGGLAILLSSCSEGKKETTNLRGTVFGETYMPASAGGFGTVVHSEYSFSMDQSMEKRLSRLHQRIESTKRA